MSDGLSNFALVDSFGIVGNFLEVSDLGRLEQASRFYPDVLVSSWNMTASRLFRKGLCWGPVALKFEEEIYDEYNGKNLAWQLHKFRRTVFPSKSWEPWVYKTSSCSVMVHGVNPLLSAPHQACVAVSVGISRGQSLVVGATLEAIGLVKDEICFGVVAFEGPWSSKTTSIMLAPFSGDCFIQHGSNGAVFKTQSIPCQACWHDAHGQQVVRAWVQVTTDGGIRFLGQSRDAAIIEYGLIPPGFLPKTLKEYFASIHIWGRSLTATIKVSVDYSGSKFPSNMHVSNDSPFEMDTAWEFLDEDAW